MAEQNGRGGGDAATEEAVVKLASPWFWKLLSRATSPKGNERVCGDGAVGDAV